MKSKCCKTESEEEIKESCGLRPKSRTSILYSMRKTVREQSSMSEFIEFEKQ